MYRCNIIGSKGGSIVDSNVNNPNQGLYAKVKTDFLKNYGYGLLYKSNVQKNENDKENMFQSLIQIQSLQSNGQYPTVWTISCCSINLFQQHQLIF